MRAQRHNAALAAAALLVAAGCTGGGRGFVGAPAPRATSRRARAPAAESVEERRARAAAPSERPRTPARLPATRSGEASSPKSARAAQWTGAGRSAASARAPAPPGRSAPARHSKRSGPARAGSVTATADLGSERATTSPAAGPVEETPFRGAESAGGLSVDGHGGAAGQAQPGLPAVPAGAEAQDETRSGGVGVWVLGLFIAGVVGAGAWLALQPPWRRWRWWGRLKRRLARLRARGSSTRSVTTTNMITMTARTPPWLAPLRGAGGKESAETPAEGTETTPPAWSGPQEDAASEEETKELVKGQTKGQKRRRRKHITNVTLPLVIPRRDKK